MNRISPQKLIIFSIILNLFLATLLLFHDTLPFLHKLTNSSNASKYPYLSKRIFAENQNDILINFSPLRKALEEYNQKLDNKLSIYFEYLPSGVSIGINENEKMQIASLIKTPLAMAVYRNIEKGKITKNTTITLTKENLDNGYGDLWKKGAGTKISIEDALHLILVESDNTAGNALLAAAPQEDLDEVFKSLDIPFAEDGKTFTISPKDYSSVFRSLYLASYVNREYSNEILDILTKTKFNDKIPAGIPKRIKVAHKIGIWDTIKNGKREHVYSDCGIVYVPYRPYLLCIMSNLNNEEAERNIAKISEIIYEYIIEVEGRSS